MNPEKGNLVCEPEWVDYDDPAAFSSIFLASNSTRVIATKAGHYIQVDEPQLVIDAILKVIDEARK